MPSRRRCSHNGKACNAEEGVEQGWCGGPTDGRRRANLGSEGRHRCGRRRRRTRGGGRAARDRERGSVHDCQMTVSSLRLRADRRDHRPAVAGEVVRPEVVKSVLTVPSVDEELAAGGVHDCHVTVSSPRLRADRRDLRPAVAGEVVRPEVFLRVCGRA